MAYGNRLLCFALLFCSLCAGADADAGDAPFPLLVAPSELSACEDAVLVDIRPPQTFIKQRIPNAVSLDGGLLVETRDGLAHMLRAPDALADVLAERGLCPTASIVIYGEGGTAAAVAQVARAFWTLEYMGYSRVALLDGGFRRWVAEGHPTESGPAERRPTPATVPVDALRPEVVVDKEAMTAHIHSPEYALVDSRHPRQYTGQDRVRGLRRNGHIPGAVNVPSTTLLVPPYVSFRPLEDFKQRLYPEGVEPDSRVIVYCNFGSSCCVLYFAYRLAGHKDIAVYDGSLLEWAADRNLPITTHPR